MEAEVKSHRGNKSFLKAVLPMFQKEKKGGSDQPHIQL